MATVNKTRLLGMHKKKGVSVFSATISYSDIPTSADIYELFVLPKNSIVVSRSVLSVVANTTGTTATADLGFTGAANALANDFNLKATAGTSCIAAPTVTVDGDAETVDVAGIFTPVYRETGGTVILTPTYDGTAADAGEIIVTIEYIELDKTNGEFTEFSATT